MSAMFNGDNWFVDPSYYQYQGCQCLAGYKEEWQVNQTVLVCVPETPKRLPDWVVPVAVAMSVVGMFLVVAAALLVWFRMALRLRSKWQRERELAEHRQRGLPQGCQATIVVTDVEQYSELSRLDGGLTMQVLGLHNAILRKAAAAHAGHVIEQEGDSWSVAFYSSFEAAAFCLHVSSQE
eukprot:gene11159-11309_t